MSSKQIISGFSDRNEFIKILKVNPGLVIMKLGAEWCGPCKKIEHIVQAFFGSAPKNVLCADIDIDDSFDLYAYLKKQKMVNGIPTILLYKKGNHTFIPDDSVSGSDPVELDAFFKRCGNHLAALNFAEQLL
jgi:thiol-disulfide isomerase/thioredoxin